MSLHAPDVRIKALAPQPSKWSRSQCVEQINEEYKITVEIKDLNTTVQKKPVSLLKQMQTAKSTT